MAQTNDARLAGGDDVTKKVNRVHKTTKTKFVPFPEYTVENGVQKSTRMPTARDQQALHDLWLSMTQKDQAVVLKFVNTSEFTSPGYGRSVRWIKRYSVAQPKQVNLK